MLWRRGRCAQTTEPLAAGTVLYHGTTAQPTFVVPRGPAWFTLTPDVAKGFARDLGYRWSEGVAAPTGHVLTFAVARDVHPLLHGAQRSGWDREVCKRRWHREEQRCIAEQYCLRTGAAGWRDGHEIMLCDPQRWLTPTAQGRRAANTNVPQLLTRESTPFDVPLAMRVPLAAFLVAPRAFRVRAFKELTSALSVGAWTWVRGWGGRTIPRDDDEHLMAAGWIDSDEFAWEDRAHCAVVRDPRKGFPRAAPIVGTAAYATWTANLPGKPWSVVEAVAPLRATLLAVLAEDPRRWPAVLAAFTVEEIESMNISTDDHFEQQ